MEFATIGDRDEILNLYKNVIDTVNKTDIKLGWNIESYPDFNFVTQSILDNQMCIIRENKRIIAVAVVNHNMNPEYDDINWDMKEPKEKISTIHALTTAPDCRGGVISSRLLNEIGDFCRDNGDRAIHLDVIDTNIPAYKLYLRNGYKEKANIKMYYEVVGTRNFWMMELVL